MKLSGVLGQSRKVVAHLVGAEITWATLSLQHGFGQVTFTEWIAQAILLATALGVYSIANDPASTANAAYDSGGSPTPGLSWTVSPLTSSSPAAAPSNPTPAPVAAEPPAPIPTAPPEGWASTPPPPAAVSAAASPPDAAPAPSPEPAVPA